MASSVQNSRTSPAGYCAPCRTCNMWCWRAFKWLPVLLIASIITWSYFAYVIQLCIFTIQSTVQQCVYLVVYHILLIMFSWSYWRTIFANIEPIPDKYKLPQAELEKLLSAETEDSQRSILENFAKDLPIVTRLRNIIRRLSARFFNMESKKEILECFADTIPVLTRTMSGSVRYCNRCVLVKPDRAHHCSICSRCVMKMDHHCPWVNNCVCFHNYKFFMLFLGYALVYCLFIMGTTLPYFIRFWKGDFGTAASAGRYHIVFAFFVSLMFAISLGSLFGYHCYLVAHNRTTLDFLLRYQRLGGPTSQIVNHMLKTLVNEAFRAPMFRGGADKNGFSLGCFNNFKEVFGLSPNLWLVPVFTSFGDGIVFPVPRQDEESESLLSSERWERWGEPRVRPFDERGSSSFDEL